MFSMALSVIGVVLSQIHRGLDAWEASTR